MRVARGQKSKSLPINIVGSSTFGRKQQIDSEYTYNMYVSQSGNKKNPSEGLVNYIGYKIGIGASNLGAASEGRAIYTSIALNGLITVFGSTVYLIKLSFNELTKEISSFNITILGELNTQDGNVYITENNKPQICISDDQYIYIYDEQATEFEGTVTSIDTGTDVLTFSGERELIAGEPIIFSDVGSITGISVGTTYYVSTSNLGTNTFSIAESPTDAKTTNNISIGGSAGGAKFSTQGKFQQILTSFLPTQITFHDTYFLASANEDSNYTPVAYNTWRLSDQNNGFIWANDAASIGLLETKADETQAVIRFPSGGNLILVFGKNVSEAWYDRGGQLFPYQRNNQFNIDYGCTNSKSIATLDTIAVWIGWNEKSGPQLMYSDGTTPKPILTDGVDFALSQLENPEDCGAWLFRQDGHLIYHVNFYSDNYSLFYDFKTQRFYNATDHNMNYFHISDVSFYKNQYFGISKNDGNFYIVDTEIPYYETVDKAGNVNQYVAPRIRSCANTRLPSNDLFIANDISVTMQSGETSYRYQTVIASDGLPYTLVTEGGDTLVTESGDTLITNQLEPDTETYTKYEILPAAYLSVSRNGGNTYSSESKKILRHIGLRQNKLQWWGLGASNDFQCKFRFESFGPVLVLNAALTVRLPG